LLERSPKKSGQTVSGNPFPEHMFVGTAITHGMAAECNFMQFLSGSATSVKASKIS